jgi:hypothetical protein
MQEQPNNLSLYVKELEKQQKNKPQVRRRTEIIRMRTEIKMILKKYRRSPKQRAGSLMGSGIKPDRDKRNRKESLEVKPCVHSQLIFNRGPKNMQWRKASFFNKWSGKFRYPLAE